MDLHLILSALNECYVEGSLKVRACDGSVYLSLAGLHHFNILGSYYGVYLCAFFKIIDTVKDGIGKSCLAVICHGAVKDVALADKVRNKYVCGLVIYFFGGSHLLDMTV